MLMTGLRVYVVLRRSYLVYFIINKKIKLCHLFQSKSPRTRQPKPIPMQNDDSPDLFSQDEEPEQPQLSDLKIPTEESEEIEDGNKMAGGIKMAPERKMASDTKMAHTSRLLEEMEKLDEESGQLNLSMTHSKFLEHRSSTPNKMASDKLAPKEMPSSSFTLVNEKSSKQGNSSKVLGKGENHNATSDSKSRKKPDSDDDMSKSEGSTEMKKKLAKKITDYFSKKST